MPTPSEQKALAFVAIVVLLGGAVRVVRAGAAPVATPLEQQALARQATAADFAAAASKQSKGEKRPKLARGRRDAVPRTVGGLTSIPLTADRTGLVTVETGINGFPPPLPRIDRDERVNLPPAPSSATRSPTRRDEPAARIDLDVATEQEIDRLPRIGPAIAHRIVASRDSFGAFGSLQGLRRVKGMGPATLERLAPLVTFSGRPSSRP